MLQNKDLGPGELVDCVESSPSQVKWATIRGVRDSKQSGEEGGQLLSNLLLLQAGRALSDQLDGGLDTSFSLAEASCHKAGLEEKNVGIYRIVICTLPKELSLIKDETVCG